MANLFSFVLTIGHFIRQWNQNDDFKIKFDIYMQYEKIPEKCRALLISSGNTAAKSLSYWGTIRILSNTQNKSFKKRIRSF